MSVEFKAWPKTPRLFRPVTLTEKIDGTNAAVIVADDLTVAAQSRNRLITPKDDNYGFAKWVYDNAEALASILGPGHHYGEWWGKGIQRGYGLDHRRFSLFNVNRYASTDFAEVKGLGLVPVLASFDVLDTAEVSQQVEALRVGGSVAAEGFDRPEGVIVFMSSSQQVYKVLLENDQQPKGRS